MYITAKVIADSIANGHRVTTLELEYPRYIHSELMTHRVFSRNAASSRAIPFDKMLQTITSMDQTPKWTLNQKGMVGKENNSHKRGQRKYHKKGQFVRSVYFSAETVKKQEQGQEEVFCEGIVRVGITK